MLMQLPFSLLEKAINQYLALDPLSAERSKKLHGKAVAIEFTVIPITFYILFTHKGVHLLSDYQAPVDTTIRGTPIALAKLGLSNGLQSQSLFTGEVEISGDMELGHDIKQFFDNIEIDWEEHLSHVIGDIAAHQIGNMARGARRWSEQARASTQQNVSEYLQEELRQFPPREEVEDFFQDIASLRSDTDRLAARVERIRKQFCVNSPE